MEESRSSLDSSVVGDRSLPTSQAPQEWQPCDPHRPGPFRVNWIYLVLVLGTIVIASSVAVNRFGWLVLLYWMILGPACALLGLLIANRHLDTSRTALATPDDEMLSADSENLDEILVRMWVEVNGVVRGADRGVVWFDEEGYQFYGHRSWFRIAHSDIASRRPSRFFAVPPELNVYEDISVLEIHTDGPRVRIGLKQIVRPREQGKLSQSANRLRTHIGSFSALVNPIPTFTCLPPMQFDPEFKGVGSIHVGGPFMFLLFGFEVVFWTFVSHRLSDSLGLCLVVVLWIQPTLLVVSTLRAGCARSLARRKYRRVRAHSMRELNHPLNLLGLIRGAVFFYKPVVQAINRLRGNVLRVLTRRRKAQPGPAPLAPLE